MALIYVMQDKVTTRGRKKQNPQSECCQLNPYMHPAGPVYLSRIIKQPLLSGLLLVGYHRFGHLMSHRGAHGVHDPVQPHLHLNPTEKQGPGI